MVVVMIMLFLMPVYLNNRRILYMFRLMLMSMFVFVFMFISMSVLVFLCPRPCPCPFPFTSTWTGKCSCSCSSLGPVQDWAYGPRKPGCFCVLPLICVLDAGKLLTSGKLNPTLELLLKSHLGTRPAEARATASWRPAIPSFWGRWSCDSFKLYTGLQHNRKK